MSMEKFQEAVHEYTKVKEIAPQTPGIREKVKSAQIELKKSKRKDYYKILELSKDAGESEIKKAYRLMAVKWHPDKHQQAGEEAMQEAERKFKDVGEAYSVLSDPQKKQQYDQGMDLEEINQGGRSGGMGGMDPNDIFQMFFQGGGGRGGHSHNFHFQ